MPKFRTKSARQLWWFLFVTMIGFAWMADILSPKQTDVLMEILGIAAHLYSSFACPLFCLTTHVIFVNLLFKVMDKEHAEKEKRKNEELEHIAQ